MNPEFVIQEVRRVLKPGGLFVGSVPNGYRLKNRLTFLAGGRFDSDPTHLHLFSPDDLRRLLADAGFADVQLTFRESRFLRLHPRLFGNTMLWRARRTDE
jgi:SAM-dependent methyltransferase